MLSTRQVAKLLGLLPRTLGRYIAAGKIPAPKIVQIGDVHLHAWTDEEVRQARQLLPKIKNGRKTRYQKENKPQAKKLVPKKKKK